MRILKFNQFVNENEVSGIYNSYDSLPNTVKRFFNKYIRSNIFSKLVGSSYFNISLEGENLYFTVKGKRFHIPLIKYVDGDVFLDTKVIENFDIYKKLYSELGMNPYKHYWNGTELMYSEEPNSSIKSAMDRAKGIRGYGDLPTVVCSVLFYIINHIYDTNLEEEKSNYLNPFDTNLDDNPIIKKLENLKVFITSSEKQKKGGTLRFKAFFLPDDITIHSNGYIRKMGGRPSPLTKNIELSRPIYTQEDLDLKLNYVLIYCIKQLLNHYNIDKDTIKGVTKSMVEMDHLTYDSIIKDLSKKYPLISHLLPDPNNAIDSSLKRGASILSRFGNF
jgi:hypothetical protein